MSDKGHKSYPCGYNDIKIVKNEQQLRTKCKCGWATPWRKPRGRPPKGAIFFVPFRCPNCKTQLSDSTWVPTYGSK